MTLAIILIIAAALGLIFIIRITVSQRLQIAPASLAAQIQPIDIGAFRNLVDPAEDEYLRRRLLPAQFRSVQRERLRATATYIQTAAHNADLLVRLGQNALAATDHNTADAAHQLVENAILLRRNCLFALLRIYIALAWPNGNRAAALILHRYEQLNGSAMLLGRLQNPGSPLRISAGL